MYITKERKYFARMITTTLVNPNFSVGDDVAEEVIQNLELKKKKDILR